MPIFRFSSQDFFFRAERKRSRAKLSQAKRSQFGSDSSLVFRLNMQIKRLNLNLRNPISNGLQWCIACEGGLNFKFVHFTCSSTRARFLSTSYTASSLFFSFPTETLLYFCYEVFDIGMINFCLFKIKIGTVNSEARLLKNKMLAVIKVS